MALDYTKDNRSVVTPVPSKSMSSLMIPSDSSQSCNTTSRERYFSRDRPSSILFASNTGHSGKSPDCSVYKDISALTSQRNPTNIRISQPEKKKSKHFVVSEGSTSRCSATAVSNTTTTQNLKIQPVNVNTDICTHHLTIGDFDGITSFCRNVGCTHEGIDTFLLKAKTNGSVAVSLMWYQVSENPLLSSNHSTTTVKYCMPSLPCDKWFCTCGRHIRSRQAFEPVLGALMSLAGNNDSDEFLYFLPSSCCDMDILDDGGSTTSIIESTTDVLPLRCRTSLQSRWDAFLMILNDTSLPKIIYNYQLLLFPILFRLGQAVLIEDNEKERECDEDNASVDFHHIKLNELLISNNVFDPKVAAFICDTDLSEADLELESLCQGYRIPASGNNVSRIAPVPLGKVSKAIGFCYEELKRIAKLAAVLQKRLEESKGSLALFQRIEMPMVLSMSPVCPSVSYVYHVCVS